MRPVVSSLKKVNRRLRRRRKTRIVRRVKPDVEMTTVDFDGKTVISDIPEEPVDTGDSQTASASNNSRHVHFSGS